MRFTLHPFYPIIDSLDWVERLVGLGVKTLQLRAKDLDRQQAHEIVRDALKLVADKPDVQLFINDYWEAAITLGADYVHIGQEDLETADVPAMRRAGIRFGLSTHNPFELDVALAARPDYVAIGPVFPPRGKPLTYEPVGIPAISDWRKTVGDLPLVAIGGLRLQHAEACFARGADAVAVITDVTLAENVETHVTNWITWANQAADKRYAQGRASS